MLRTVEFRARRGFYATARCVCLAMWFAWAMSLAAGVPTAIAQSTPQLWSIELNGGLFGPIQAREPGATAGMRYSKHYNAFVRGGLLTGLTIKNSQLETPVDGARGVESRVELARAKAQLVPLMGFVQVDLTGDAGLVPYVGIGAGYEWLTLDATDHRTGAHSNARYGNIAWETYAGMGVRLTSRVRADGEVYYNGGSLERRVTDPSGAFWREAVHVNGVGARAGLDMIFE